MQAYAAQRAVVTRYIKEQMTEGVDYYTLTIKGRVSKATLSKAGSEKFLSLFQLHAAFHARRGHLARCSAAPRTGCCATPARS